MTFNGPPLPPKFAADLRSLYSPRKPSHALRLAVAQSRANGWTLQAMADVLGVSREYVRQLAPEPHQVGSAALLIEVPLVPVVERPEPVRRIVPRLTADQAQQLRDLHLRARPSGGGGRRAADHPDYLASLELAGLLQGYVTAGHRQTDLAAAVGITPHALRLRLGRHGYRGLPPSVQPKSYPIPPNEAVSNVAG